MKTDRHARFVEERSRRSAAYRKTFARTLHQIDLALLVREMREGAGLTQVELAKRIGTTQSVIARLEDAERRLKAVQDANTQNAGEIRGSNADSTRHFVSRKKFQSAS